MLGRVQFKKVKTLDFDEWYDTSKIQLFKDSEGFKSVLERIGKFLEEIKIKYYNKNILLITHGDVCKAIYAYLNNINDAKIIRAFEQENCEIVKYDL